MTFRTLKLADATADHIHEMMRWFPDHLSCVIWGGPSFRFPFTETTFFEDMRRNELPSYALLGDAGELLGFGQYYPRVGRCHLGRLVVAPGHRGRGIGRRLIGGLVGLGMQELKAHECSLFVLTDNLPAIRLYEKLGFVRAPYPEDDPHMLEFEYMIAPAEEVLARCSE